MTTSAIPMMTPTNPLKATDAGVSPEKRARNNDGTPMFAAVLKGRLQRSGDQQAIGEVDLSMLLKSLQQLLQTMQEEQKDPKAEEQVKKAIDLLKKIMLDLSQNDGERSPDSFRDVAGSEQDLKTKDVRYNIQSLGWFEQQIENMLAPPEEGKIPKQQTNLKSLLESLEGTIHRLIQILAKNGNASIHDDTIKALQQTEYGMNGAKTPAYSGQVEKSGKPQASEPSGQHGKQEAGQTVNKQTGQTQTASERSSVTVPFRLKANHSQAIAASVFRRTVAPHGKNESMTNTGAMADFQSGPMSRLEQLVLHARQGEKAYQEQQFVRDFRQMLANSFLQNSGGRQQLTMKLYPRHLGTLNVQLTQENGEMTATLITSTAAAKHLVDSQLSQLRNAFAHQNLHIDKVQVLMLSGQEQANQAQDSYGKQQEHHHEEHQKENEQHVDEDDGGTEVGFSEWLEEVHLN